MSREKERKNERTNFHSLTHSHSRDELFTKMMGDFYTNNDSIFNEAQRLVARLSDDELKNLMTNDAEVTKFVQNLPEVGVMTSFFRFQTFAID